MSSQIIQKQSNTAGKIPLLSDLELGEFAINTYDGKIFLKTFQEYFDDNLGQTVTEEDIVEFPSSVPVENTIYVQKGGDDTNDGDTWSSAFATIEAAMAAVEQRNSLTLVKIGPGVYTTRGHIDVPDNTVIQATHRSVFIRPEQGFEERNVFRLGSGCFLEGPIFENWRLDDLDNPTEGFAVVFRPGAKITRVPYAHKIAVRTPPYWTTIAPPLDRENANPLVGRGAGVVLADASVLDPDSIYPNIMTWGATPVTHNGIGYCAKNGGLINAVNAISMWAHKHFYALSGGQIILSSCSTQFGDYTLVAEGTRELIDPYSISETTTIVIDENASQIINNSAGGIINNLITELNNESFTTDWPETYEELTRRDSELLFQALTWFLQTGNEKPVLDFAKGFFDTTGNRAFDEASFDYDKCYRDTLLINQAIAYDILFGSTIRTTNAGLAYFRQNANKVLTDQLGITVQALQQQQQELEAYLTDPISVSRSNTLFTKLIDILTDGPTKNDPVVISDPTGYNTSFLIGYGDARTQIVNNKTQIQDDLDTWISLQITNNTAPFSSSFTYDSAACRRDVGYILDALRYDLTYGGNLETYNAAIAYFVGTQTQLGDGEKLPTIAAYTELKNILNTLLTDASVNSSAITFVLDRIDDIIGTINSDGTPPQKILPNTSWPDASLQTDFSLVNENTNSIANNVLRYINVENKTLLGAFIFSWEFIRSQIISILNVSITVDPNSLDMVTDTIDALIRTILNPNKMSEPSTITAIGHTWTGIMSGVALTKIPPATNQTTIQESILELDRGLVIASGQDDQGSALFIGGMEINADTGELSGPPFDTAVNRVATRAAIARSF